ncbi:MAG TPA: hypothetical protein VKT82_32940 [Ktedonobacterales bacterium]|nr:hypothetical protein [Ktedonobacterales bacterium]
MTQRDSSIPDALRLHPGQQELTPEQEAEARRFANERIQAQLSTEPIDEQEVEAWLLQAYQVAGLESPSAILWLDGPLNLVGLFVPPSIEASVDARAWGHLIAGVGENVGEHIWAKAWKSGEAAGAFRLQVSVRANVVRKIMTSVSTNLYMLVRASVGARVEANVWAKVNTSVRPKVKAGLWERIRASVDDSISASVRAYAVAAVLGGCRFFDEYLVPNDARPLAHFNELVSGYWLGKDVALIVRRPKALHLDADGQLHNAAGKCIEYHDGWGFYTWHGGVMPERLIPEPEQLAHEDF